MKKLNLPECELRVKDEEGNQFIFDIIRKKYVVLTPEEWVRQHFIHLMINQLKYPRPLIKLESGLTYFKSDKRSDIVLMDRKGDPYLIVECKAPEVSLKKDAVSQAAVYNKVIKAKYLAVTNGLKHFIWEYSNETYVSLAQFPEYPK